MVDKLLCGGEASAPLPWEKLQPQSTCASPKPE